MMACGGKGHGEMGEIRKITCQACGRNWELRTGSGLRHGLLENAVSAFSENFRKKILSSMVETEFPIYDFTYQPAHCGYCCQIVSVPVLTPMEKEAFTGGCPICGRRVKLMKNITGSTCPVCGEKALFEEETGIWD